MDASSCKTRLFFALASKMVSNRQWSSLFSFLIWTNSFIIESMGFGVSSWAIPSFSECSSCLVNLSLVISSFKFNLHRKTSEIFSVTYKWHAFHWQSRFQNEASMRSEPRRSGHDTTWHLSDLIIINSVAECESSSHRTSLWKYWRIEIEWLFFADGNRHYGV